MKSELTDQEKQQFQNIDEFNAKVGSKGWHVKDKKFYEQNLTRIELNNSSMTNCDLDRVTAKEAKISNTKFEKVRFLAANFSNSSFSSVEFTDCDFEGSLFEDARFEGCTFRGCNAEQVKMENVSFERCEFRTLKDKSGSYSRSRFTGCKIEAPDWENGSFYNVTFDTCSFSGGKLVMVVFDKSKCHDIKFAKTSLENCNFEGVTAEGLQFENCKGNSVAFGAANLTDVRFLTCKDLKGFNLSNGVGKNIKIEGCTNFSEASFYQSKIAGLTLKNCFLPYLDATEAELSAPGIISGCRISGLNLSRAKLTGIAFEGNTIEDYLVLNDATFENAKITGNTLAPGLEIHEENVKYVNADRFR